MEEKKIDQPIIYDASGVGFSKMQIIFDGECPACKEKLLLIRDWYDAPKQITGKEFYELIYSIVKLPIDQYYDLAEFAKKNNWIKNNK